MLPMQVGMGEGGGGGRVCFVEVDYGVLLTTVQQLHHSA